MACCGGKCHGPEFDEDREGVCQRDLDRFGGDDITCPQCGTDVYHDAALCQACGHAMTERDASGTTRSARWVPIAAAVTVIGLLIVIAL